LGKKLETGTVTGFQMFETTKQVFTAAGLPPDRVAAGSEENLIGP
jgi:hypothetical protein